LDRLTFSEGAPGRAGGTCSACRAAGSELHGEVPMSVLDTRRDQMFPLLDTAQMETARRFASGPARTFAPEEVIFEPGSRHVPTWLVLEGAIEVVRRDGLGHQSPIAIERPGQFSGDISQLSDHGALATGRAGPEGCTAVPIAAP